MALVAASIHIVSPLFRQRDLARFRAEIRSMSADEETLIDAVAELKLEYPDAIAKVIHGLSTAS